MQYQGITKKSRTLDLAGLLAVLGAVQVALPDLALPPQYNGIVTMIVGVLVAFLRFKTTGPVGEK